MRSGPCTCPGRIHGCAVRCLGAHAFPFDYRSDSMSYSRRWLAILGLVLVAGCGPQAGENQQPKTTDAPSAADKKTDTKTGTTDNQPATKENQAEKKVELKVLPAEQLFAQIKKRSGKVVVVDCWSTWCEPCKKEF